MKRRTKTIIALTVAAVLMLSAAIFIGALTSSERSMAIIKYVIGNGEEPENGDVNNDGSVDIYDALIALKEDRKANAYLSKITFDDEAYSIDFDRETFEYTVEIPLGHPTIPQVEGVTMEGLDVVVQQAFIPEGEVSGTAYILVTNESGKSNTYTVTFEKTAEAGFELQYDDRYTFKPAKELADGESYTFTSDKPELVSVDENGVMTALKVTNEPVTVTASCGDVSENLVITRVDKAHVNLFLLTGQSNGQGCYGNSTDKADQDGYISFDDNIKEVPEIGVDGAVYSYDVYPYKNCVPANTFYDMNNEQRTGPAAALGKAFYDLSGEKVVFLQTAYSGAPIQSWLDTETRQGYAGLYGSTNYYDATQKAYADLMAYLDANNYEVIRTCNFWWHGGTATRYAYVHELNNYDFDKTTGKPLITDKEYYDLYMMMHEDMIRDFGLDYDFMILNRIQAGACYFQESKDLTRHTDLVPIRASQIALANLNEDIIMASTKAGEYARMYSATQDPSEYGYNFVGLDNVHFNQIGHNATGEEAGTNAFYALKSLFVEREAADHVEIIDTNGRDRLTSTDTIELKVGSTYRIAGLASPIYSEDITYSSSNKDVVTIDEFGLITAVSDGYAMITVTSESGKTESVEVYVYSVQKVPTMYRWEFVDDLNTENDDNALTLSAEAIAKGASASSYTLDGSYTTTTTSNRPDFLFETPISVSSETDWSFEWKATLTNYCVLAGQTPAADSEGTIDKTSQYGCIYLAYKVDDFKALRFKTPDKSEYYIEYGDYLSYNEEPNTWKLTYTAETKMLKLEILLEDVWTLVNDVEITKAYDFNFTNLFGRYSGGSQNFRGTMEYLEIKCVQEVIVQEKNYRYEFDGNLLSSEDKNDLTLSPDAMARGSSSDAYTLTDNMYTETASTKLHRADFLFEKPVRMTNKMDWTIEWSAALEGSSQLMGQSLSEADKTQYGCIYLAYATKTMYCLRLKTPATSSLAAKDYKISYGDDYKSKNTSLNTWKLEHKADTQLMTLYFKGADGWETVGSVEITSDYDFAFTNLFGTYQDSVFVNMNGTVDYVDIYTKETIYQ